MEKRSIINWINKVDLITGLLILFFAWTAWFTYNSVSQKDFDKFESKVDDNFSSLSKEIRDLPRDLMIMLYTKEGVRQEIETINKKKQQSPTPKPTPT